MGGSLFPLLARTDGRRPARVFSYTALISPVAYDSEMTLIKLIGTL